MYAINLLENSVEDIKFKLAWHVHSLISQSVMRLGILA